MRIAATILLALSLSGCGTILTVGNGGVSRPLIYSGTRLDGGTFLRGGHIGPVGSFNPFFMLFALLDFPLSLATDTLLLPYTVVHDLTREEPKAPEKP